MVTKFDSWPKSVQLSIQHVHYTDAAGPAAQGEVIIEDGVTLRCLHISADE